MRVVFLVCSLGSALACTKPEPLASEAEPEPVQPVEKLEALDRPKPKPEPEPAPPLDTEARLKLLARDVDLARDPTEVGADLAAHWCELGGDAFRPPGQPSEPPDDDYPPRLASCNEVRFDQHARTERDGIRATHFTIDASSYEQHEFVLLQSAKHAALLELYHTTHDSSGEEGTVWRDHIGVELRDVTGSSAPEWIAKLGEHGGDSYEADRCYSNVDDSRELVLCSETATGFVCARDSYHATSTTAPRAKDQLDECDALAHELDPRRVAGYAMNVEVGRDRVLFTPSKTKIHEPEDPPRTGEVAIAVLLEQPAELTASAP